MTGCPLQCTKHFADTSVSLRHKIRKIAVEILQSVNNRTQSLQEKLPMVIIEIVINTRLTPDPAGMQCPAWDDAFVSSCLVISQEPPENAQPA